MSDETKYVRDARARGHKDFRSGVPYAHCPYLTFPDCPEGKAWQNGWLAEKEQAKRGIASEQEQNLNG